MSAQIPKHLADITGRAWVIDAECAKPGRDPDLWFPESRAKPGVSPKEQKKQYARQTALAISVCNQCPVLWECLIYACQYRLYGIGGVHGVWAGRPPEWFNDRKKVAMTLEVLESDNEHRKS